MVINIVHRLYLSVVFLASNLFYDRVARRQNCFLFFLLGGMVEAHLCARTLSLCTWPVNTQTSAALFSSVSYAHKCIPEK